MLTWNYERSLTILCSKRQYVHQLKKWDASKYKKGAQVEPQAKSNMSGRIEVRDTHMRHNRSGSTSSLDELDHKRETRSVTLSSQSPNDTDEDEDIQQSASADRWDSSTHRGGGPRTNTHKRMQSGQSDKTVILLKKAIADFDFAMSDDKASFQAYKDCYDLLKQEPGSSLEFLQPFLVILMARSAQTTEHIDIERTTLEELLSDSKASVPRSSVYKLLEAYMLDRNKDKDGAKEIIRDVFHDIILDKKELTWLYGAGFGVIPYPFLVYGIRRYNEDKEAHDCLDEKLIVADFLRQLEGEFRDLHDYSLEAIVGDCLDWCIKVLDKKPEIPTFWHEIPCNGGDLLEWKDDYEVFCYLWQTAALSGPNKPFWAQRAEQDLCISATELLITMSYLIMDGESEENNCNEAVARKERDSHHLVQRALNNARVEADGDHAQLWSHFLDKFYWMNQLVDMEPKDKTFKTEAMDYVRKYVADLLTSAMHEAKGGSYPGDVHKRRKISDHRPTRAQLAHGSHHNGQLLSMVTAQNRLGEMQLNLCLDSMRLNRAGPLTFGS